MDNANQWLNHYPVGYVASFVTMNCYPMDCDLQYLINVTGLTSLLTKIFGLPSTQVQYFTLFTVITTYSTEVYNRTAV